ncbi:MAG TPA: DUF4124 domain-containing protein [Methylophaga aminisulfidivorans]|uniref:DUF4124 domain-containing protein n=2 Tax=root TaxID=1 RepID=A0A7C1ZPL9_9GAMM|nr:DUF4124 domain-containing protein [Methylophaga aminisulfidivorans]
MRYILLILLTIMALTSHAQIYRWVDDSGDVVFSDEDHPGAEKVDLQESTVYSSPNKSIPVEIETEPESTEQNVPDYVINITSPADNESIWVNNGDVKVTMTVEPSLDKERGDGIVLLLDGNSAAGPQTTLSYQFSNLSRGSHQLEAKVVNNQGEEITSSSITFHLHQASQLNN